MTSGKNSASLSRRRSSKPRASNSEDPITARIAGILAIGALILIQLVVLPNGADSFRLPKLLLLHAVGTILISLMAIDLLFDLGSHFVGRSIVDWLLLAVVLWTLVATAFSTQRVISLFALLTMASAIGFFLAFRVIGNRIPLHFLIAAVSFPAVCNSVVVILQRLRIWNPLAPVEFRARREGLTALLGNIDEVGVVLLPAFVAACCYALVADRRSARLLSVAAAVTIGAGLLITETRAAIVAAFVALGCIFVLRWRTRGAIAAAVIIPLLVLAMLGGARPLGRFSMAVPSMNIARLSSDRLIAFAAAWRMIEHSPIIGIGPGCFVYLYPEYASRLYPQYRQYVPAGRRVNFGDVHNDHLQIAAETGLPAYGLFLFAVYLVARQSWRAASSDVRSEFARLCGLPLMAALTIAALFQFPLQLSACLVSFVFCASLCLVDKDKHATP